VLSTKFVTHYLERQGCLFTVVCHGGALGSVPGDREIPGRVNDVGEGLVPSTCGFPSPINVTPLFHIPHLSHLRAVR